MTQSDLHRSRYILMLSTSSICIIKTHLIKGFPDKVDLVHVSVERHQVEESLAVEPLRVQVVDHDDGGAGVPLSPAQPIHLIQTCKLCFTMFVRRNH